MTLCPDCMQMTGGKTCWRHGSNGYTPPAYRSPYVPFEARVKPEVLAVCKALHQIEAECVRFGCEYERHEDDAAALLSWLDEYDFRVAKGRRE